MSEYSKHCMDATLNTLQHSDILNYCISYMQHYSCQREHINVCSNPPFLSSDSLFTHETTSTTLQLLSALTVVCLWTRDCSLSLYVIILLMWSDCVFFVFECLLCYFKLWVFFKLSVIFRPKGDYACSKSVLYSFTLMERVDMGTISCTISHLSQLWTFLLCLCFYFLNNNVPEWTYQQVFLFFVFMFLDFLLFFFSFIFFCVSSRAPDLQAWSNIQQALMLRMWHAKTSKLLCDCGPDSWRVCACV